MDQRARNRRPRTQFTQVPDQLIFDDTLSAEALAALLWVCAHPEDFITRAAAIRARFGWGRHTWLRVRRELIDRGAIETRYHRCRKTGQVYGSTDDWTWEPWLQPTEGSKTEPPAEPVDNSPKSRSTGRRKIGPPPSENRTGGVRKPDALQEERKKEGAGSAAEAAPPAPDRNDAAGRRDAMQPAADGGGGEEDRVIPSVERRRELARELLGTDAAHYFPGLVDADRSEVP